MGNFDEEVRRAMQGMSSRIDDPQQKARDQVAMRMNAAAGRPNSTAYSPQQQQQAPAQAAPAPAQQLPANMATLPTPRPGGASPMDAAIASQLGDAGVLEAMQGAGQQQQSPVATQMAEQAAMRQPPSQMNAAIAQQVDEPEANPAADANSEATEMPSVARMNPAMSADVTTPVADMNYGAHPEWIAMATALGVPVSMIAYAMQAQGASGADQTLKDAASQSNRVKPVDDNSAARVVGTEVGNGKSDRAKSASGNEDTNASKAKTASREDMMVKGKKQRMSAKNMPNSRPKTKSFKPKMRIK